MILLTISNIIKVQNLSKENLQEIIKLFTFSNPLYYKLKNMNVKISEKGKYIKTYRIRKGILFLPRGGFLKLKEFLENKKLEFKIIDERLDLGKTLNIESKIKLRPYQTKLLKQLIKRSQNILEAPPGSGKTVMALVLILLLKRNTLIIVNKTDLAQQWKQRIKEFLNYDSGFIGSGIFKVKNITVAMIQTLNKLSPEEFSILNKRFSCVICDEVHHLPAPMTFRVLNKFKARFRYGLTATLKRKDHLEFLLYLVLGSNVVKLTDKELMETNFYTNLSVEFLRSFSCKIQENDWNLILENLINNERRNRMILKKIKEQIKINKKVLVLTNRIKHVKYLAQKLNCKYLIGEIKKEKRMEILNNFRLYESVLISTYSLLGEGLDFPEVDVLFLTIPVNNFGLLKQLTGRIKRKNPNEVKYGKIFDVVDLKIPLCFKMFKNRKKFYKKMNISIID